MNEHVRNFWRESAEDRLYAIAHRVSHWYFVTEAMRIAFQDSDRWMRSQGRAQEMMYGTEAPER